MVKLWSRVAAGVSVAALTLSLAACGGAGGSSGDAAQLNVIVFPGAVGDLIKKESNKFEQENNVKIRFTEASSVEAVAKITAAKANPEYDVAFVGDQDLYRGTDAGLWASLGPSVDTSTVHPEFKDKANNGVPLGVLVTGLFYNKEVFDKEGWPAPTSFQDLLDQKYCGKVGITNASLIYGVYAVLGLGGLTQAQAQAGDLDGAWNAGLQKLAAHKDCVPTFETSSAAYEQKIQTGQYIIGDYASVRLLPLKKAGVPIELVTPPEGGYGGLTMVAAVKDSPNPDMAQRYLNFVLKPDVQTSLMENTFYSPSVQSVVVTPALVDLGMVTEEELQKMIFPNATVARKLSGWLDEFQRSVG